MHPVIKLYFVGLNILVININYLFINDYYFNATLENFINEVSYYLD